MKRCRRSFGLAALHDLALLSDVPDLRATFNQQLRDRSNHREHRRTAQSAGRTQSKCPREHHHRDEPESIRLLYERDNSDRRIF